MDPSLCWNCVCICFHGLYTVVCTVCVYLLSCTSCCVNGWKSADCKSLMVRGRPNFSLKQQDHIQLSLGQIKEVGSGMQLQFSSSSLPRWRLCLQSPQPLHPLWLTLRNYRLINDIQSLLLTTTTSYPSDCLGLFFSLSSSLLYSLPP